MADETKTTERTLRRLYRNRGESEPTKRLSKDVQYIILESIAGGGRVEADLERIFEGTLPPPSLGLAAAAFGMNTVLGNEIAGKDKSDPAALMQLISDRLEAIYDGDWSEGRQGPIIKHVLEAWASDARDRGKNVTDAAIATMRAKLESGETTTKDLLNKPTINAWYQKHKADRALAAFEKAKAAASAAGAAGNEYDPD